jgi:hypothetical protein
MVGIGSVVRLALAALVASAALTLGAGSASATELSDYLWQRRPLLLFAPTASDPRLAETLSRIDASRCDFAARDMVVGQVVAEGTSTLDGHVIDADEAQRLLKQYAIEPDAFTALLIGKDGGEKLRVGGVPELSSIYAVIDGMPMRQRESNADVGRC